MQFFSIAQMMFDALIKPKQRIVIQEAGFESEVITNQKHWFLIKAKSLSKV